MITLDTIKTELRRLRARGVEEAPAVLEAQRAVFEGGQEEEFPLKTIEALAARIYRPTALVLEPEDGFDMEAFNRRIDACIEAWRANPVLQRRLARIKEGDFTPW